MNICAVFGLTEFLAVVMSATVVGMPAQASDQLDWSIRTHWNSAVTKGSKTELTAWIRGQNQLDDNLKLTGEGYLTLPNSEENNEHSIELRRAYLTVQTESFHLRLGRQIETWGRADGLNPTDVLSAKDFRKIGLNDDTARLGIIMARADIAVNDVSTIKTYWIPEFRRDRYPNEFGGIEQPASNSKLRQGAIKFERIGRGIDWSVTWYQGLDHSYDLVMSSDAPVGRFNHIKLLGADVSANLGSWGMRGEIASVDTVFDKIKNPLVRRPELWFVLGADTNLTETLYFNLQYSNRRSEARPDDCPKCVKYQNLLEANEALRFQQGTKQEGVSLAFRFNDLGSGLFAEINHMRFFSPNQGITRAQIRYKANDLVSYSFQLTRYFGLANTFFGSVSSLSGPSIQVIVGF